MTTELRRYSVPSVNGLEGWGIFVIGMDGYFSAVTDFGNYAYFWGHHGRPDFREFLAGMVRDSDYLCGKLGTRSRYDHEGTVERIRRDILEMRRDASLSKEEARREWDLLEQCNELRHTEDFSEWYRETELSDAGEYYRTDFEHDLLMFATKLYPRFAALLLAELTPEQAATAA